MTEEIRDSVAIEPCCVGLKTLATVGMNMN